VFVLADGGVGLIDEQDILVGPDTYDGVSLLGERGMPRLLAPASRTALQEAWAAATSAHPGWRERWLQVRIQRALKVLGTFARLSASGSTGYERWIAPLAREVVPDAVDAGAPSALTDLLLDLSPRHHPHGGGDG
jgi:aminoglycoside/choline kinase family phosphotransferase